MTLPLAGTRTSSEARVLCRHACCTHTLRHCWLIDLRVVRHTAVEVSKEMSARSAVRKPSWVVSDGL